jgi:hypothetical protein
MHTLRSLALLLCVILTVGTVHAQSSTPLTTTPSPAPTDVAIDPRMLALLAVVLITIAALAQRAHV